MLAVKTNTTEQMTPPPDAFRALTHDFAARLQAGDTEGLAQDFYAEGARLLQRTIAAVPAQPSLHIWPGISTTYGFPQETAVAEAKRLLAAPRT